MPITRSSFGFALLTATLLFCGLGVAAAPHVPAKPPPPVTRVPTAAELYQRSLQADRRFSYRGRQVTTNWRTGHSEAVIVSHRAPDLRRIDYLEPDARRGSSVVLTAGQPVWQYSPTRHQLIHFGVLPAANSGANSAESFGLLRSHYVLKVQAQKRTWADRKVFVITIMRRSERTLSRKLWIDAATGLALKREYYREDGKIGVTVAFTDINYHGKLPASLFDLSYLKKRSGVHLVEVPAPTKQAVSLASVKTQLSGAALVPTSLAGYRLVSAALVRNGGQKRLDLQYSDGLNLVSLSEQKRVHLQRPTHVPSSMRPIRIGEATGHISHAASLTTLNWDAGVLNLTLMGEISEAKILRLAVAAETSHT